MNEPLQYTYDPLLSEIHTLITDQHLQLGQDYMSMTTRPDSGSLLELFIWMINFLLK